MAKIAAAKTAATPSTMRSKRKRNTANYVVDDYYDKLELQSEPEYDSDSENASDNDVAFGSRRTKSRAKKAKTASETKRNKSSRGEKPFRFLDLPAELRDLIFEAALVDSAGMRLSSKIKNLRRTVVRSTYVIGHAFNNNSQDRDHCARCSDDHLAHDVSGLTPNILAVSKQLREEGSAILYRQTIALADTTALHTFITQIGPYNRRLVKSLTVNEWGTGRGIHKAHNYTALSILAGCTNLKTLYLNCTIGWNRPSKNLARQIYRDGHYFLEAMGVAEGKYDAGVDIIRLSERNFTKPTSLSKPEEKPEHDPASYEAFELELRELLGRRSV